MTDQTFNDIPWHDSVLINLNIDRSHPGERDDVLLLIELQEGRREGICFKDCYALDVQMNLGVIAPESILAARCIVDSSELAQVRQKWSSVGVDLNDLRCYEITTNSTASVIRVFARRFERKAHPH